MQISRRKFMAVSSAAVAAATVGAPSKKKYKACIIGDSKMGGYGHWIQYAFALREDVIPVALADPVESERAKIAKSVGAERSYADYREMLEKERPDLVAVASPNEKMPSPFFMVDFEVNLS